MMKFVQKVICQENEYALWVLKGEDDEVIEIISDYDIDGIPVEYRNFTVLPTKEVTAIEYNNLLAGVNN